MNENECIKCGDKTPTTQEPNIRHICNPCAKRNADEEQAEFSAELEEAML